MKKCLQITIIAEFPEEFLRNFIQKHARKLELEGTVQFVDQDQARIFVCGEKEEVDLFLDVLHEGTKDWKAQQIDTEPSIKEKDYRGIFRVIE